MTSDQTDHDVAFADSGLTWTYLADVEVMEPTSGAPNRPRIGVG